VPRQEGNEPGDNSTQKFQFFSQGRCEFENPAFISANIYTESKRRPISHSQSLEWLGNMR
jgi:hypothetical protein